MDVIENEQLNARDALNHWYYESKYLLIKKSIESLGLNASTLTTADVGTGIGLFLRKMEIDGLASEERSIGVDPAYAVPSTAIESMIPLVPSFPSERRYDLILMMDVLEHVQDDESLLKEALDHLNPGGYLFITVPALPVLESAHDNFLGHFRRYTLGSLKALIGKNTDVSIINAHYFFACLLPIAVPLRLLKRQNTTASSDMKPAPRVANHLFRWICSMELVFSKHNKIAGLTAVAICRKIK